MPVLLKPVFRFDRVALTRRLRPGATLQGWIRAECELNICEANTTITYMERLFGGQFESLWETAGVFEMEAGRECVRTEHKLGPGL